MEIVYWQIRVSPLRQKWQLEEQFLKMPRFTRGKKQMPAKDVDYSGIIAHARIHVERVIGRIKKFSYLQSRISVSQVNLLDDEILIISVVISLNNSIVT